MKYVLQMKEAIIDLFRAIIFASQKKIINSVVQIEYKIIFALHGDSVIHWVMDLFLFYKKTVILQDDSVSSYFCIWRKKKTLIHWILETFLFNKKKH